MFNKACYRTWLSVCCLSVFVWQIGIGQEDGNKPGCLPYSLTPAEKLFSKGSPLDQPNTEIPQVHYFSPPLSWPSSSPVAQEDNADLTLPIVDLPPFTPAPATKKFAEMIRVEQPLDVPWNQQVRLFVTAADGRQFSCTGTLIDAAHVITACHCVYASDKGGWAREITAVPAFGQGRMPYGAARVTEVLYWSDWIERQDYQEDMAVLRLDRPVGALTGWMSYSYNTDRQFFSSTSFDNASYPSAGPYDGQQLYNRKGTFDFFYGDKLVYHYNQGFAGQSGSSAFVREGKHKYTVYTVLSHGTPAPHAFTGHVRITEKKYENIRAFIQSGRSSSLPDLQPLALEAPAGKFTLDEKLDAFSFVLYNNAQKDYSGDLVTVLDLILPDQSTYELGRASLTIDNLPGGESKKVEAKKLAWRWPSSLNPGDYALSVRLVIEDAQLKNNQTTIEDQFWITIDKGLETPFLEIDVDTFSFPSNGGVAGMQIRSNQQWEVQTTASWIAVSSPEGSGDEALNLKIEKNEKGAMRTAELIVQTEIQEKRMLIKQNGWLTTDSIRLYPGWNLISVDVEPEDSAVALWTQRLRPGNLIQINGLENGLYSYYRPGNPLGNTLKYFKKGAAYWIQVKALDWLVVEGKPIDPSYRSTLLPGRNLVAYLPEEAQSPEKFFSFYQEKGLIEFIIGYKEGRLLRYDPRRPGSSNLVKLENGHGYWVELKRQSFFQERRNNLPDEYVLSAGATSRIAPELRITPFLADKRINIQLQSELEGTLLLMLTDLNGRILKRAKLPFTGKGHSEFQWSLEKMPPSVLVLSVFWNGQHIDSRVYLND